MQFCISVTATMSFIILSLLKFLPQVSSQLELLIRVFICCRFEYQGGEMVEVGIVFNHGTLTKFQWEWPRDIQKKLFKYQRSL
jgi:hypothetical protein